MCITSTVHSGYWAHLAIRQILFIRRMVPCAKDQLLSACAINRVRDGGERSSENHGTNGARSTLDGRSEVKQKSYTGFPTSIIHNSHPLQLTPDQKARPSKIHQYDAWSSACLLEYTMPVAVRIESSSGALRTGSSCFARAA